MINGYVTYKELLLITGLENKVLDKLIRNGLTYHEISYENINPDSVSIHNKLFNLEEVINWISLHIY